MKVLYGKYSTSGEVTIIREPVGNEIFLQYTTTKNTVTVYKSYGFNTDIGYYGIGDFITTTEDKLAFGGTPGSQYNFCFYPIDGISKTYYGMIHYLGRSKDENNIEQISYNTYRPIISTRYFKGSFIESVEADEGSEPSDGIGTGGFWYVRFPPNPPSNLIPKTGEIVNKEITIRLSWKHYNPSGTNAQSKFELVWRVVGQSLWNYLSEVTTRQYQDMPAFTFPLGQIEWQVKTFDQTGLSSEWSSIEVFSSGSKPESAIWVSPINGEKITKANPIFQWSTNVQKAYRLVLYNMSNFIIWDTGEVEDQSKLVTSGISLEDGVTYTISLRIRNAENFWSEEKKVSFTTSYSPPPKPNLTLRDNKSTVVINITNPTSTGVQPATVSNDVYKLIDDEWIRIAKNIPVNGEVIDYTARSKIEEQYKVKAVGDNEGIIYSDSASITITFKGVYLHDTTNPELTVHHFLFDGQGRSENWSRDHTLMKFKGRKNPTVEFSENEESTVKVALSVLGQEDLYALQKLTKSYNTLCYRDGRGRLLFGFVPGLPVTDQFYGSTIDFNFTGIDYKGSV